MAFWGARALRPRRVARPGAAADLAPRTPSAALARFGVDELTVTRALGDMLGRDVDDADLYFENIDSEFDSIKSEYGYGYRWSAK
mgnify:CR=1 FL=1